MTYRLTLFALGCVAILAACDPAQTTRNAMECRDILPENYIGGPIVDMAALDVAGPTRIIRPSENADSTDPSRLTIQADGNGRVAGAFCG